MLRKRIMDRLRDYHSSFPDIIGDFIMNSHTREEISHFLKEKNAFVSFLVDAEFVADTGNPLTKENLECVKHQEERMAKTDAELREQQLGKPITFKELMQLTKHGRHVHHKKDNDAKSQYDYMTMTDEEQLDGEKFIFETMLRDQCI
mgnify:CR=1 FL=1